MAPVRIAVVSPFIDKRHGTERRIAEWIARLPQEYEIHIYSQRIEDVDLTRMRWHRIPRLPGPHLLNFLWWLAANHVWRWWDSRVRGLRPDLVYTAGTNCWDADLISVHIVFAEFVRQAGAELRFSANPIRFWPRLVHRWLYYKLMMFLERRMYSNPKARLILIARKTANDLKRHYDLAGPFPVVYIGLDKEMFNPELRQRLRPEVRRQLGLRDDQCVLVLVGNDWKKKGLVALVEALAQLKDLPLVLVVAGKDDEAPYQHRIRELGLEGKVKFCPSRADVQWYYAAADIYTGPSLEDTFAQPPAEAMACGLPVITTATNGTAEIMTDGVDGLILQDPNDVAGLADRIQWLYEHPEQRESIAAQAAATAAAYTWDRNGVDMRAIFAEALVRKGAACSGLCADMFSHGAPAGNGGSNSRYCVTGERMGSLSIRARIRLWGKRLLFPGLDVHTRSRYRFLTSYFKDGPIDTLDAGCGNGALSYASYLRGNRVLGVTKEPDQVRKDLEYFSYAGTDPSRLKFEVCNLYELPRLNRKFDQIICSETLEHIARDTQVVQYFHGMLRDGGVLHVCCPYSEHPGNKGRVCADESMGWHVRDGYTIGTYRALLEPAGFEIIKISGFGSPLLVKISNVIQPFVSGGQFGIALILFFLTWPLQLLDYENPRVPWSLYVKCVKKPENTGPPRMQE